MTFHPFNFPASVETNEAAVNETSAMKFPRADFTVLITRTSLMIDFFSVVSACESLVNSL